MKAIIEWLTEEQGGRLHPPSGDGPSPYLPLIRFPDEPTWPGDADWSLKVRKERTLRNPDRWIADVDFLFEGAPRHELREGREFELHEGGKCVARGRLAGESALMLVAGQDVASA